MEIKRNLFERLSDERLDSDELTYVRVTDLSWRRLDDAINEYVNTSDKNIFTVSTNRRDSDVEVCLEISEDATVDEVMHSLEEYCLDEDDKFGLREFVGLVLSGIEDGLGLPDDVVMKMLTKYYKKYYHKDIEVVGFNAREDAVGIVFVLDEGNTLGKEHEPPKAREKALNPFNF